MFDSKQDSDSAALYSSLSQIGAGDDDVVRFLEEISYGAYALVWYDARAQEIRFARNDERPLHFVNTSDGLFWASERRMLEFVLANPKLSITPESEAFQLAEHKLVSIPVGADSETEARVAGYTPRTYVTTTSYGSGSSGYGNSYGGYGHSYQYGATKDSYGTPFRQAAQIITSYHDVNALRRNEGQRVAAIVSSVLAHDFGGIDCASHTSRMPAVSSHLHKWLKERQQWASPNGLKVEPLVHPVMTVIGVSETRGKTVVYGCYELDDGDGVLAFISLWKDAENESLKQRIEASLQGGKPARWYVPPKGFVVYCTGEYSVVGSPLSISPFDRELPSGAAEEFTDWHPELITYLVDQKERNWSEAWESVAEYYMNTEGTEDNE
jgi:hypothetical protein